MKRQGRSHVQMLGVAAFWIVLGLLTPTKVNGQQDYTRFEQVPAWVGSFTVSGNASGTTSDGSQYTVQQSISGKFNLNQPVANGAQFWGTADISVNVHDKLVLTNPDGSTDTTEWIAVGNYTSTNAFVNFNVLNGTFAVYVDYLATFGKRYFNGTLENSDGFRWGPIETQGTLTSAPGPGLGFVPLPTTGMNVKFDSGSFQDFTWTNGGDTTWTIVVNLTPASNYDLVVTIPDYDQWRPTGGFTEEDTGPDFKGDFNLLRIEAQLMNLDGTPAGAVPDDITFSLVKYSTEPGVSMNWPPVAAQVGGPDLSFDPGQNHEAVINTDDTVAKFKPQTSAIPTIVLLSPHDWGGWGTLNVTATVAGKTISGHLAADTKATDILLPKRQPDSFIADAWKIAHNLPLGTPDSDDSENDPVGDGQKGDGFTLWEEYRGFYMGCAGYGLVGTRARPVPEGAGADQCQHVEGDPGKKDLFVVTTISAESDLGIERFKSASGLSVHYLGLDLHEINENRVINFNHERGPHNVDQHALIIVSTADQGASHAVGGPGLPFMIKQIEISNVVNPEEGDDPSRNEYVNTVAHELAHGASVWHHGELDQGLVEWSLDANGNVVETRLGAQGTSTGTGVPIRVLPEDADPFATSPGTVAASALGLPEKFWVGNRACGSSVLTGGQHSGDEFCIMRYDCAEAYIPLGLSNVRFLVSENPGFDLTAIPQGTGVNFANRFPRSRYGDADTIDLRGECRYQLDVNDSNVYKPRPSSGFCAP